MSEPTRYTQNIKCVEPSYLAQNIQSGMVECSIGEWVLHSDYARLKAEVERLRASSFVTAVPVEEYEKLKAEVDRLNRESSDVERFNNSQCEPNTRGYYLKLLNHSYDESNEHYRLFVVERSKAGMAEDEIKRLKAEVERSTAWGRGLESDLSHARVEISFLKAEVERLRASSFVTAVPVEQYERVIKAGDKLVDAIQEMDVIIDMDSEHPEVNAWNAAKEGKQP